jgi:hypothetical protein
LSASQKIGYLLLLGVAVLVLASIANYAYVGITPVGGLSLTTTVTSVSNSATATITTATETNGNVTNSNPYYTDQQLCQFFEQQFGTSYGDWGTRCDESLSLVPLGIPYAINPVLILVVGAGFILAWPSLKKYF